MLRSIASYTMLNSVTFCSLQWFKRKVRPSSTTLAISILAQDEWDTVSSMPKGFAGHIKLCFVDIYEESFRSFDGTLWADLAVGHENGKRMFVEGYEVCDLNDAIKVVKFLNTYANKPESFDLVVHCMAGASRSAAVAEFVKDHYQVPIVGYSQDTSCRNYRFFRLLEQAFTQLK